MLLFFVVRSEHDALIKEQGLRASGYTTKIVKKEAGSTKAVTSERRMFAEWEVRGSYGTERWRATNSRKQLTTEE